MFSTEYLILKKIIKRDEEMYTKTPIDNFRNFNIVRIQRSKKMKKEKEQLFNDVNIDTVQMAKDILAESEVKLEQVQKAMKIGAIATVGTVISLILLATEGVMATIGNLLLVVIAVISIISYIIGGGVGMAIKFAWKMGKIGWYILPIPLVDLAFALMVFFFALVGALYVPVLFIWLSSKQIKRDQEEAEEYLKYAKE